MKHVSKRRTYYFAKRSNLQSKGPASERPYKNLLFAYKCSVSSVLLCYKEQTDLCLVSLCKC